MGSTLDAVLQGQEVRQLQDRIPGSCEWSSTYGATPER